MFAISKLNVRMKMKSIFQIIAGVFVCFLFLSCNTQKTYFFRTEGGIFDDAYFGSLIGKEEYIYEVNKEQYKKLMHLKRTRIGTRLQGNFRDVLGDSKPDYVLRHVTTRSGDNVNPYQLFEVSIASKTINFSHPIKENKIKRKALKSSPEIVLNERYGGAFEEFYSHKWKVDFYKNKLLLRTLEPIDSNVTLDRYSDIINDVNQIDIYAYNNFQDTVRMILNVK